MGIHDGHRDRLRKRFMREGLQGFEEHTALELLLFYARPRSDTNAIAHELLEKFGSFAGVLDAPPNVLAKVRGLGETSAVFIKLIPALCGYYLGSRTAHITTLDSTRAAGDYFVPRFFGRPNEEIYLAALDDRRKLLRCVRIGEQGIVNAVRITVKQVVTEAVNANAAAVILAHNHPGGVALPSAGDKQITRQIFRALQLINVQLADHIIVADDDFVSMADLGFISLMKEEK